MSYALHAPYISEKIYCTHWTEGRVWKNRKRQEYRPKQYSRLGHPARWATNKLSMLKTMAQNEQEF
jgi:hypothetical protein